MGDILHPQYKFFHHFIFVWATGAQSHLYNPFIRSFGQQNHIALGFKRQKWCTKTSITSKALSLSSTVIVFRSSALVSKSNWKSSDIFEDYCDNHHQYRKKDYHIGDCVFRLTFGRSFALERNKASSVFSVTLTKRAANRTWQSMASII